MTALKEYERLEAAGVWRESNDAQSRNVIVSIGDATLVISDMRDNPLTHWSLAAVARANPGQRPAVYHPDGDATETLEIDADNTEMVDAIEKLRRVIEKRRPHPGRLRWSLMGGSIAAIAALCVFWLPNALRNHTLSVVPQVKREQIGARLLSHITRVSGKACSSPQSDGALRKLSARLPAPVGPTPLVVLPAGVETTAQLPGGTLIVNRALIEDYETPDILAGYIIAERLRAQTSDPLKPLLTDTGIWGSFQLLTTGDISDERLETYAETLLRTSPTPIPDDTLLAGFKAWNVPSTPYAYALDVSGETTLHLIEADPHAGATPKPVLDDGNWLRLQGICEN